ncbi:unnamed protein product [Parajaminaea phylloscopi]
MREVLLDANFPRDSKTGATYHVGTAPGQVANRILTVGDFVRARRIAKHFDGGKPIFEHQSQRNFLTLTGTYRGVPLTVVAIGMGFPLVDFFLRECRAVVSGDLIVVRLGSCGSIDAKVPLGSIAVPSRSYGIFRNYDWFHPRTTKSERDSSKPYTLTLPLEADAELHDSLVASLQSETPEATPDLFDGRRPKVVSKVVNGSADSFYSSQGRLSGDAFWDANETWVDEMAGPEHGIQTLEMETYLLHHLAMAAEGEPGSHNGQEKDEAVRPRVRTAAVQMIFANRHTSAFITPDEVHELEAWAGKAVCDAMVQTEIPADRLHGDGVWSGVGQ